jgi:cytochrome P450
VNRIVAAVRAFRDPVGLVARAGDAGSVVRLACGRRPVYVVSSAEGARAVLDGPDVFTKGSGSGGIARVLGRGLQVSEGMHHRRERALLEPQFARDRLVRHAESVTRARVEGTAGWRDGDVIDVVPEMRGITTAAILRAVFADASDRDVRVLTGAVTGLASSLWHAVVPGSAVLERTLLPGFRRLRRSREAIDRYVGDAIRARRSGRGPSEDILAEMLAARAPGDAMSDRDARDEVVSLLLAGRGTITAALSWTWLLIGRDPRVEARLHAEVDAVIGEAAPSVADLDRLPYARAVWDEALRVYPPAWILRRVAVRPAAVAGRAVPARATVLVSLLNVHRDPDAFARPERFDPARFVGPQPEPFTYLPFGAGPHGCLGFHFATMEAVLLLAGIARRWRLVPVDEGEPRFARSITLRPAGPLRMRLVARSP